MATASSAPACILIDSTAYVDNKSNHNESTAADFTSKGNLIEVSLWPARPPIPSRLSVHCPPLHPDEAFFQEPSVICTADCFFLLRIVIGRRPNSFPPQSITQKMCDYFVYRPAASTGPSLRLLKNPHPHFFRGNEVGLLPRRGEHFTIAVLCQTSYYKFMIHLFKSEDWDWSSKKVLVDPPQIHYPMPIADNRCRHFEHLTNSVITLGREGGTIGWVDLWRGILFYDVFLDIDKVRFLPLPARLGSQEEIDCCPMPYRSIAVIGDCFKLIELKVSGDRLPGKDPETRGPKLRIDDWALTTYTYNITAGDGWKTHRTVKASDIRIDRAMHSVLRRCGMLRMAENSEAAEQNLQNLWTCQPVLSLTEEGGIVYLITRVKFQHPKAWVLALDMRKKQVQAMAAIETERSTSLSLAYFPSRISGYLNETMQVTGSLRDSTTNQLHGGKSRTPLCKPDAGESTAA